jgi:hypothetical protein
MKNLELKRLTKMIVKSKEDLSITKGEIGGVSIEIFNNKTFEDIGSFIYYDRVNERNDDYNKLMLLLDK